MDKSSTQSMLKRIDLLNQVGSSLSQEKNVSLLIERILFAAKEMTNADGGTIYRVIESEQLQQSIRQLRYDGILSEWLEDYCRDLAGRQVGVFDQEHVTASLQQQWDHAFEALKQEAIMLRRLPHGYEQLLAEETRLLGFETLCNDTLKTHMGGSSGKAITFPPLKLYLAHGQPNHNMVAAWCALNNQPVNIPDAYQADNFDLSGTRNFDKNTGYHSKSFLTLPMTNHEGVVIGVLQLINCRDESSGEVIAFDESDQTMVHSLASQAAIALTNNLLIQQMEGLFEALIDLINQAIEEKSPYTGGHCMRVPDLTSRIAEALTENQEGPLKDFSMTEKDKYELHIAGMLHDCGKITTPVHVVDKGTKLETIFDRIHLLDTRFEVLKRDAEIEYLKACMARGVQHDEALYQHYQQQCQQYDQDREFLRRSNVGGEFMQDDAIARIKAMANYSWCNPAGERVPFLDSNELENLCIRAGTLTAAERDIINYHIVSTINMLYSLPWPKHLTNVPEYAGGHHERMDGKGYPKGLKKEQMSVQARCMAIADIFEALTAADRPYKKGKTLTEALTILGKFKINGHIDPDIFDVFIKQRVWLDYAHKYMPEHQIDNVDLATIPGVEAWCV